MRGKLVKIFACMALIMAVSSEAFAVSFKAVNERGAELADSISFLASQIIANNKHSLQVKLTKAERTYDTDKGSTVSPYTLNRVWAKDSTIVCGCAKKNKKFDVEHIITNDPKIFFVSGIHVGDTLSALEEFLGATIIEAAEAGEFEDSGWDVNASSSGGIVTWDSASENADSIVIYFDNRKVITQIEYFTNKTYLPVSDSVQMFISDKLKELKIFK